MKHAFARKLRRQQPIGLHIADFVCFDAKLVIELDGGQICGDAQDVYDQARTKRLEVDDFRVIRFSNTEMIENFDGVLEGIRLALRLEI